MATDAINGSPGGAPPGDPASSDALLEHVEELNAQVDRIDDLKARETAQELVAAVLELYGVGLERIIDALNEAGDEAAPLREKLVGDNVVASLLLIHDLYPVPLADRVAEALDNVRPYMESHGGNVELLSLTDGVARLRLSGSCDGCPASASTLELAIKQALDESAPDLAGLEVEGVVEGSAASPGLAGLEISGSELPVVQVAADGSVESNGASPAPDARAGRWIDLDSSQAPSEGVLATADADGMEILIAKVTGSLLAFRNSCAACESELASGQLKGGVLACPSCERRFYLPRAGRSMDEEALLLEPVPLLEQNGAIRIAVPA